MARDLKAYTDQQTDVIGRMINRIVVEKEIGDIKPGFLNRRLYQGVGPRFCFSLIRSFSRCLAIF